MRFRFLTVALLAAFVGAMVIAPASTAAQPTRTANVTASAIPTGGGDPISGTVSNLVASVNQLGELVVTGNFLASDSDSGVAVPFEAILGPGDAACQILYLDIGPIFLDLLGLQVSVSQIIIDITAQPGPGNLLGNLLCAVAGLLDGGGPLQNAAKLLNRIFANLL
jgi:hypothetical protein